MEKNSKGFTLIELLAVIVVLAIIMVIATTQVNKAMKGARKDSFVQTAKVVVKETQNRIVAGSIGGTNDYGVCVSNEGVNCTAEYGLSETDYYLEIISSPKNKYYYINLYSLEGGKFASVKDLNSCDMTNVICLIYPLSSLSVIGSTEDKVRILGPKMSAKLDANGNIVDILK